ncbi:glutamate racemase [Pseudofulvibacter geojedonensis]|uniref:Glutamate racemase n=1 Tax=Pseudofulvibacter geojedonensis TaxID=1123758 RepID=A0ABW3I6V3_9FLAO
MNNHPIGIFDSGIGGLSIWKEIHSLMPYEKTIYLADSINAPYGQKTKQEIVELCIKNTEFLISKGCKIIVVACNTATTNAITYLRDNYSVPFIGIEPAIKPAALQTKTKAIGVLATKGTLSSELFHSTSEMYAEDIHIVEQIGAGLVELIESGNLLSKELDELLESYMQPMLANNIDYLVLGCTHYPLLIPKLKNILPKDVKIIDSGEAVARQTLKVLKAKNLTANDSIEMLNDNYLFYNNKEVEIMKSILDNKYQISFLKF